jgi:hypothetical protein
VSMYVVDVVSLHLMIYILMKISDERHKDDYIDSLTLH